MKNGSESCRERRDGRRPRLATAAVNTVRRFRVISSRLMHLWL